MYWFRSHLNQRWQWHPTPVLLPGESYGQRSPVGCSPWGRKESDRLSDFTFTFHFHTLEKEMATHSSVLAWRIPEMWEPGELPPMGSHRIGSNWSDLAAAAAYLNYLVGFPYFLQFNYEFCNKELWSESQLQVLSLLTLRFSSLVSMNIISLILV